MSLTHSETVEAVKSKIDLIADILCRGYDVELRNISSLRTIKVLEIRKIDACKREADNGGRSGFNGADDKICAEGEKTSVKADITC